MVKGQMVCFVSALDIKPLYVHSCWGACVSDHWIGIWTVTMESNSKRTVTGLLSHHTSFMTKLANANHLAFISKRGSYSC